MPIRDEVTSLNIRPIRTKKLYEEVTEELKRMIREGELKPGDRLASVKELAEAFNVGRSAVREALSALQAMGLIEMRQGEGTFVRNYDPAALVQPIASAMLMNREDIRAFLEVRKILEVGAVGLAASRRTADDLVRMEAALREMEESLSAADDLGEAADVRFHLAIAQATKNRILIKLMNTIADTMQETMRESRRLWLYAEEATAERLYREHVRIYEAIRDQDAPLAQQRMLAHLVKVEEVLNQAAEDADEPTAGQDPNP